MSFLVNPQMTHVPYLSGFANRHKITVDATKVDADLTDYPVYVDLSDLSLAGSDIFDIVQSAGEDIRVTKSDGQTEVPVEVVDIDTSAKTGELHFKADGTLSSSTDTDYYIYYNGNSSAPARTATYGSENVWNSGYTAVYHLQEAANNSVDGYNESTSNANHGQGTSMAITAPSAALGKGAEFDGTSDWITSKNNHGITGSQNRTNEMWLLQQSEAVDMRPTGLGAGGTANEWTYRPRSGTHGTTQNEILVAIDGGNRQFNFTHSLNVQNHIAIVLDGTLTADIDAWGNGTALTQKAVNSITVSTDDNPIVIGARYNTGSPWDGIIDEFRLSNVARSAGYITTGYNNQNSPSTFYTVGAEETA